MATSGSLNTSGYNGRYLVFSWIRKSYSITNNTTTIEWTLKGAGTAEWAYYRAGGFRVVIDGATVYSKTEEEVDRITLGDGTLVASGTYTLSHNSAGEKSFTVSVDGAIYLYARNVSGSKSFTLDVVPRASQPSCITWPEHTQNVGEFGDTISIHMNRMHSSLTHTVRYKFGDQSGTIATGVGTGTTWTIPLSLMNRIPNSTSGSGTIYVDTYSGSTLVGTKSCGFTATVPASVKPSCTATLEDTTGIDDVYGSPVQGLSKIKVTATATTAYSSPIASYEISVDGIRYTTSTATSGFLKYAGLSRVVVKVTDKRGRSGSWSYDMNVQQYTGPSITTLTVNRCNADGTANDQGQHAEVIFSTVVSSMGSKNTATYKLRYKKTSATTWTEQILSDLANNFAVNNHSFIFAADETSTYNVELIATDRHKSVTAATKVSTAFSLYDIHPDGTGLRFGGVAEKSNTLQNDLDLVQQGNRYTFSSPGVSGQAGYVLLAKIEITAANADTPITFVLSRRASPTTMTVWVQLKNSTATASSLTTIQYDGANYGAFLVKTSGVVWDLYVQKGSTYDTISIQDWYTSGTMSNRVAVTFPGTLVTTLPEPYYRATPAKMQSLLDYVYPVGSIYLAYNHTNPGTLFGGTWTRISNAFLWAVGADGTIGQTGGESEVTLTTSQIPAHSHGSVYSQHATGTKNRAWFSTTGTNLAYGAVSTGGGEAHNNMPPYIQVSAWRRTA